MAREHGETTQDDPPANDGINLWRRGGYEGEDDKEETEGEGKGEDKEEVDEEHAEEEIYSFHLYPKILGLWKIQDGGCPNLTSPYILRITFISLSSWLLPRVHNVLWRTKFDYDFQICIFYDNYQSSSYHDI